MNRASLGPPAACAGRTTVLTPAVRIPEPAPGISAQRIYPWVQAAAIGVALVLITAILHIGSAPYIAFAFAGGFVIHMAARPDRIELGLTALFGLLFASIYFGIGGPWMRYFGWQWGLPASFLGMGSVQTLAIRWIRSRPESKPGYLEQLAEVALLPALCVGSMIAVGAAIYWSPATYDRLLYVFDFKLGGPPSWVVGKLFRSERWVYVLCGSVYNSLPLGLAICLAAQAWERKQKRMPLVDLRWLSVALGIAGFVLYQVCPAAGPAYLFPSDFPQRLPDLAGVAIQPALMQQVPRNGMPSLHVGWTMLLCWNMRRRSKWIAAGTAVYLTLTALATLGLGEHYLIDLVVAMPLGLAVQAGCTRGAGRERNLAMAAGALLTLGWLIALRTGLALAIPSGAVAQAAVAGTLVLSFGLLWRLERAAIRNSIAGISAGRATLAA